jgi:hypothetical protein
VIELLFRAVVAALFLLAATLLPLMLTLTGDPTTAAAATAILVPLAALLLAGVAAEYQRWRGLRVAMRAWSRREHPANARRRGGNGGNRAPVHPPTLRLVAVPPASAADVESPTAILRKVPA